MDEQKLFNLQDEYSTALSTGNNDRARELEKQLDEYITQGTITESAPPVENDPKVEENTDPADEPANAQPEAVETSPSGTESPEATTEGEPAPNKETTETADWLASLDPKVRENVEKLIEEKQKIEHQYKSREGREAAYQRRYEEQRKLAVQQEELIKKLKQSSTALPQGQSPAAPKKQTPSLTIDDDPDLKQIAETDEQLARTMLRREQQLRQELDQLRNMVDERLSPLQQRFEEVQINSEMDKLLERVPNAIEVFNSREWDEWVSLKSERVKALALSDKADDALEALRLYAADMQMWYGNNQEPQPATKQEPTPKVDPRAGKVQQERERKLQAQPVGSASVRPPQKAEPTLEEIMADPELLAKEQEKLYKKELERMGKLHLA